MSVFRRKFAGYNNSVLSPFANKSNVTEDLGLSFFEPLPPIAWGVPEFNITGFSGFTTNVNAPYVSSRAEVPVGRQYGVDA
jgi:hypothetical protein